MGELSQQSRRYLILLVCITALLFGLGLANHGLWTPDEPRVAEIGREMALNGNWAVPMLNQRPFLEQPPLYYATLAIAFKALGVSDSAARVPSAVFAFGGVIILFLLANMFFGPRAAFISGFIMATCGEYFRVAHWVIVDGALTFFVLLSLASFMVAYRSESSRKRLLYYALCYLSCTLAFFVKGFIGVAIPALTILAFLFFRRDIRTLLRMHLWLGAVIFLAMVTPWFFELWRQGGREYLTEFLIHNHLGRFTGGVSGHDRPFYYYLVQFPFGFLPWSLLIPPVFFRAFRKTGASAGPEKMGILFAKCWFIAGFIFLSLASTKRVLYLMPLFAPVAMMTAWYIDTTLREGTLKRFDRVFASLFALAPLLVGVVAVPFYLFFCRKYDLPSSWLAVTWIIAFSLVAVILSVEAIWRHRREIGLFWCLSSGAVVSLLLLVLVVMPLIDGYKSFVPFSRDVMALVPASAPLHAYRPDETLRGALPFYTGRYLVELETAEQLKDALDRKETLFVVARDKRGQLKAEIFETGSFSLLTIRGIDTGRSLLLFRSGTTRDRKK